MTGSPLTPPQPLTVSTAILIAIGRGWAIEAVSPVFDKSEPIFKPLPPSLLAGAPLDVGVDPPVGVGLQLVVINPVTVVSNAKTKASLGWIRRSDLVITFVKLLTQKWNITLLGEIFPHMPDSITS